MAIEGANERKQQQTSTQLAESTKQAYPSQLDNVLNDYGIKWDGDAAWTVQMSKEARVGSNLHQRGTERIKGRIVNFVNPVCRTVLDPTKGIPSGKTFKEFIPQFHAALWKAEMKEKADARMAALHKKKGTTAGAEAQRAASAAASKKSKKAAGASPSEDATGTPPDSSGSEKENAKAAATPANATPCKVEMPSATTGAAAAAPDDDDVCEVDCPAMPASYMGGPMFLTWLYCGPWASHMGHKPMSMLNGAESDGSKDKSRASARATESRGAPASSNGTSANGAKKRKAARRRVKMEAGNDGEEEGEEEDDDDDDEEDDEQPLEVGIRNFIAANAQRERRIAGTTQTLANSVEWLAEKERLKSLMELAAQDAQDDLNDASFAQDFKDARMAYRRHLASKPGVPKPGEPKSNTHSESAGASADASRTAK